MFRQFRGVRIVDPVCIVWLVAEIVDVSVSFQCQLQVHRHTCVLCFDCRDSVKFTGRNGHTTFLGDV